MTKCEHGECYVWASDVWGVLLIEPQLKLLNKSELEFIDKFKHCPDCGYKIDWERIDKELKDYFKKLEVTDGKDNN